MEVALNNFAGRAERAHIILDLWNYLFFAKAFSIIINFKMKSDVTLFLAKIVPYVVLLPQPQISTHNFILIIYNKHFIFPQRDPFYLGWDADSVDLSTSSHHHFSWQKVQRKEIFLEHSRNLHDPFEGVLYLFYILNQTLEMATCASQLQRMLCWLIQVSVLL